MPTISSTLKMLDGMSGPLARVIKQMNTMIESAEKLNRVMSVGHNTSLIPAKTVSDQNRMITANQQIIHMTQVINNNYQQINNTINQQNIMLRQTNNTINQAAKSQQAVNQAIKQGEKAASGLWEKLKGAAAAYLSFRGAQAIANVSDEYVNTLARLDLINDGLQTTAQLQEKIFAAANRARGSYSDMASVIGRMGVLAANAFKSNDELIAFTELMQKSFRVGGSSTMEQQAGMYQLAQAMAAGRLQGDEFRSIMENAPMLAQAIAKFTGKSMGELKKMSAEGTITADIIKGAMFAAADEINRRFEKMPRTFGDVMNLMKNSALQAFGPAIQWISQMLNDPKMAAGIEGAGKALAAAAVAAVWLLNVVGNIANFMSTNWPVIEPMIWGIVAAFGAWLLISRMQAIAQGLLAVKTAILTAAMIGQIAATQGLAAAWRMLTAAQKANIFILLISAIVALVLWLVHLWKTNDQFAAALYRAWNAILNFFDRVPVFFLKVGMGFINAFQWAKVESLKLMEQLINGVIDGINWLIEKLNKIPGVSLGAVSHVVFAAKAAAEAEAIRQVGDTAIRMLEAEAARRAAEREQKVLDFLNARAAKRAQMEAEKAAKGAAGFDFSKWQTKPNIGKVDEVGKIRDTVDISSEDLKMMRELTEMKAIQNFVTLTPTVQVTTGPISKDVDVETVIARIEESLTEQIASSAKGLFA